MTEIASPALAEEPTAPADAADAADAADVADARGRIDLGRVLVVGLSAVALLILGIRLAHDAGRLTGPAPVAAWVDELLTAAMYALMAWAYLRRVPARASSRAVVPNVAAVVATVLPLFLGVVAEPQRGGVVRLLTGDLLLAFGLSWSLWAMFTLRRSFSVIAQARVLVDRGPYRWIRHPLYTGEILSVLGMAVAMGGALPLVMWCWLVGLQIYRAVHEERLLGEALPGYVEYRARTARLLPGLF